MQYMGGKSRIAGQIAEVILGSTHERSRYIEPFLGAGSVAEKLVPEFRTAYLSDASPDLIAMWLALQNGWEPPAKVSRELYDALRDAGPSALRAFAGYGCSFGGKWFGGYAANSRGDNYANQSRGSLLRKICRMSTAGFFCLDYREVIIPWGSVVYLDPPYAGTTPYDGLPVFDHGAFWDWAEALAERCDVFVSEYSAPSGWASVWSAAPRASMRIDDNKGRAREHVWRWSG